MSRRDARFPAASRPLISLAAAVVVFFAIKTAADIVIPLLLATLIAVVCSPLMHWLRSLRIPTIVCVVLILSLLTSLGGAVAVVVTPSVRDIQKDLPRFQLRLYEVEEELTGALETAGIQLPEGGLAEIINPRSTTELFSVLLASLLRLLGNGLLILLLVAFMLAESSHFPAKVRAVLGHRPDAIERVGQVTRNIRRYLAIKTAVSLVTGLAIWAWLAWLEVDYPFLWGFLGFVFNYVPNVGPVVPAIPATLLAYVNGGLWTASWTATAFLVVNQLLGSILEPRLQGEGLGLSTFVVFASLLFWGWVLGPIGMLLSAPLTMVVKIVLDGFDDTNWVAVLLASRPPPVVESDDERAN